MDEGICVIPSSEQVIVKAEFIRHVDKEFS